MSIRLTIRNVNLKSIPLTKLSPTSIRLTIRNVNSVVRLTLENSNARIRLTIGM